MVAPKESKDKKSGEDPGTHLIRKNSPKVTESVEPQPISGGGLDKLIDYAFNPIKEKLREMTIIDPLQARLFPSVDMMHTMSAYVLSVASYREDPELYAATHKDPKPVPPDLIEELLYRTAQWRKSIGGKNFERAMDLALAEQEAKMGEGSEGLPDAWIKD